MDDSSQKILQNKICILFTFTFIIILKYYQSFCHFECVPKAQQFRNLRYQERDLAPNRHLTPSRVCEIKFVSASCVSDRGLNNNS